MNLHFISICLFAFCVLINTNFKMLQRQPGLSMRQPKESKIISQLLLATSYIHDNFKLKSLMK